MSTAFAEPPRHAARPGIPPAIKDLAAPGPATGNSEATIWHVYVPGADVPPCNGEYFRPRRTPRPRAQVPKTDIICDKPECFG